MTCHWNSLGRFAGKRHSKQLPASTSCVVLRLLPSAASTAIEQDGSNSLPVLLEAPLLLVANPTDETRSNIRDS
jgi:hypothetical protein